MNFAPTAALTYLVVFRDAPVLHDQPASPEEMGKLLESWLEWHDRLEATGRLRFRSPVGPAARVAVQSPGQMLPPSHQEQREPVIGYLLVEATDLAQATELARGCPGLAHGFRVEIYPPDQRGSGCARSRGED